MKKIAILVADLYDDNELYYPYYRLLEEGYEVHLIGALEGHSYKSKFGLPAVSNYAAKDVKASDYDALVIPGGFSPDYMRRSSDIVSFARDMDQLKKPIAAICHGAWLMASSCELKGKKMTCFHSIKDDIIHAGAIYVDEPVVVDGHYVTSRTPKDLPVFVKTLIQVIES
jgi:protease I